MSVLCNWRGYWALCGRVDPQKDICYVRSGPWMPQEAECPTLSRIGKVVRGYVSPIADIVFYPTLYFHGLRVEPIDWGMGDDEPLLRCSASPNALEELEHQYFQTIRSRIGARYVSEVLVKDGWMRPDIFVFEKYFHVDLLDKVEGPPPDRRQAQA